MGAAQYTETRSASGHSIVERISHFEDLRTLREHWNRLSDETGLGNPFLSYDWYAAWFDRMAEEAAPGRLEPWVLVVRRNGVIVAIAPLVRRLVVRAGLRMRKIEFLSYHSDYNALFAGGNIAGSTSAIMEHLVRSCNEWEIADWMELREDTARIPAMTRAASAAELHWRLLPEQVACPYLPIDAPWAEMRNRRKFRFANRAYTRLEKHTCEGLRVRVIERPESEPDLLQRMIAVEAQKCVGGELSAPLLGKYPEVFRNLLDTLGRRGKIALLVLEQDRALAAWLWLFRAEDKLWGYLSAYHHEYSSLSPGTILDCAGLDYGQRTGCCEYDFLRGMDRYKLRWATGLHRNRRMILWNARYKSRLAAWALLRKLRRSADIGLANIGQTNRIDGEDCIG